jgi:dephospho-CoA kinase
MKVIGLTGGIGCGKSTVAGMLRDHCVSTIDADAVAREIRDGDPDAGAAIEARFGTREAPALAAIVFEDSAALLDLEAIVHPRVRDRVRAALGDLAAAGVEVAVVEAIKLLESPVRAVCDQVWVVVCRPEDALARLAERGMTEANARARMANQASAEDFQAAADVVIDGSAPIAETRRQVERALTALRSPGEEGTGN